MHSLFGNVLKKSAKGQTAMDIINKLRMLDGNSYGLYMLDQELGARVYTTPSPLAAKE